jgi:hypothetical protein
MREQLHVTCEELCGPDNTTIQLEAITGFLRFSRQALFNHFHRPIETKAIGRPKCLPAEPSEIIWKIITNHFERWAPVKYNFHLILLAISLGSACGQIPFDIFVGVYPQ